MKNRKVAKLVTLLGGGALLGLTVLALSDKAKAYSCFGGTTGWTHVVYCDDLGRFWGDSTGGNQRLHAECFTSPHNPYSAWAGGLAPGGVVVPQCQVRDTTCGNGYHNYVVNSYCNQASHFEFEVDFSDL